uniref:Secreted protein n=1 Tax=Zooxanthella nutricula TaxID=1333877 RepID=A0A6U9HKI9_9DINO
MTSTTMKGFLVKVLLLLPQTRVSRSKDVSVRMTALPMLPLPRKGGTKNFSVRLLALRNKGGTKHFSVRLLGLRFPAVQTVLPVLPLPKKGGSNQTLLRMIRRLARSFCRRG